MEILSNVKPGLIGKAHIQVTEESVGLYYTHRDYFNFIIFILLQFNKHTEFQ